MSADNTVVMNRDQIQQCIPHRPPMLLVDEIVQQSDQRILCRKAFRPDEFFFQGHYPGQPIVPGVILCEAAMQAGALLLAQKIAASAGRVPVATRMNDVKFKRMVRPGEVVDLDVVLQEQLGDAFFLKAKVLGEKGLAVRFEFGCTLATVHLPLLP